jgi:hypothetical protein
MIKGLPLVFMTLFFGVPAVCQEKCRAHVESDAGFSFCPPRGWTEANDQKPIFFRGPASEGFVPNFNMRTEASDSPLPVYLAATQRSILGHPERLGVSSIVLVEQTEFATRSPAAGFKVIYRSEYKGMIVRSLQYLFDGKSGQKVILTCTVLERDAKTFDQVCDAAARTFQIAD